MKILGTGVDLVEVPRFEETIKRRGSRFLHRIFTSAEIQYAKAHKTMTQHLAVRFAAKEAVVKALGAPKGLGLKWHDLEIAHGPSGQPKARFRGSMRRFSGFAIHLSLTHTHQYAIATALALCP